MLQASSTSAGLDIIAQAGWSCSDHWQHHRPRIVTGFRCMVGSSIFVVLGQLVGLIGTGVRSISYGRAQIERSLLRKPRTLTHAIVSGSAIVSASSRKAVRNFVVLPALGWHERGLRCLVVRARNFNAGRHLG